MGWTSNVNYTLWAGNQTFYLGDWLCKYFAQICNFASLNVEFVDIDHRVRVHFSDFKANRARSLHRYADFFPQIFRDLKCGLLLMFLVMISVN